MCPFVRLVAFSRRATSARQNFGPYVGKAVGLEQGQGKSLGVGDKGQRDTGIARGRLNNRGARLDQALMLKRCDHRGADPILDAGNRIEKFQLGQNLTLGL